MMTVTSMEFDENFNHALMDNYFYVNEAGFHMASKDKQNPNYLREAKNKLYFSYYGVDF